MPSKTLSNMCNDCDIKQVLCKKCNELKDATTDNFYLKKGKLRLYACKECIKKVARDNYKPYESRSEDFKQKKREGMRQYRMRKRLNKPHMRDTTTT